MEAELEAAIHALSGHIGPEKLERIRAIVQTNLARGRLDLYLSDHLHTPQDYVRRVAGYYERLHPTLHSLQVLKSEETWLPLYERLQRWAYKFLVRQGVASAQAASLMVEAAQAAAVTIATTYFPYDVEFEPWAVTILRQSCLQLIRHSRP
ncbi:MAG: hypothetical protein L0332_16220 [Chloroflexi bacterium]|nr:hypothetical protein [Chloroflexota bacterium]MCI0577683.1 hypothetical protein [Chloroflexota bacterium]MCI0644597.1 hypothetical protein [Chloroflexota bacterium]MCI0728247.1 hypothetical protein [Chloroflexota bacterium]